MTVVMNAVSVVSFYRFFDLKDPSGLRSDLLRLCAQHGLLGTVLIAPEGVNGTLAGNRGALEAVLAWLSDHLSPGQPIEGRWSEAAEPPFRHLRVKEKREIVTLGRPDIRPQQGTGRHVSPREWNALLDAEETLVIDTRNRYEIEVGTFPQAIDPETDSFRQFPAFVEQLDEKDRERPVAMFCTGGIRCEKAAALMLEMGFTNVNQLEGGILKYLENVDEADNRWQGECFVFDQRVAVDKDLAEGDYVQCHACRRPLSSEDLASPDYREGVSCPRCIDELEPARAARLEERRRQVALARDRGEQHIGPKGGAD